MGKKTERPLLTVMPDYFPTTVPQCKAQTDVFFQCFEREAAMRSPTDIESAPNALVTCQEELWGYKTCMDKNIKREGKAWWQLR